MSVNVQPGDTISFYYNSASSEARYRLAHVNDVTPSVYKTMDLEDGTPTNFSVDRVSELLRVETKPRLEVLSEFFVNPDKIKFKKGDDLLSLLKEMGEKDYVRYYNGSIDVFVKEKKSPATIAVELNEDETGYKITFKNSGDEVVEIGFDQTSGIVLNCDFADGTSFTDPKPKIEHLVRYLTMIFPAYNEV